MHVLRGLSVAIAVVAVSVGMQVTPAHAEDVCVKVTVYGTLVPGGTHTTDWDCEAVPVGTHYDRWGTGFTPLVDVVVETYSP